MPQPHAVLRLYLKHADNVLFTVLNALVLHESLLTAAKHVGQARVEVQSALHALPAKPKSPPPVRRPEQQRAGRKR